MDKLYFLIWFNPGFYFEGTSEGECCYRDDNTRPQPSLFHQLQRRDQSWQFNFAAAVFTAFPISLFSSS